MKRILIVAILLELIVCTNGIAQKRNSIWCFGHKALIDFNNNNVADSSSVISRGSSASICDTNGNLLFYVANDTGALYAGHDNSAKAYSQNHQVMVNGDSLNSDSWYNEIVIIPFPDDNLKYYIFTIGVTSVAIRGMYYSIVDLSLNGGLGAVTQKNVQLLNAPMTDCLSAIKHGNGRDWWVICRKSSVPNQGSNNIFYKYLITPGGISNVMIQHIGSQNTTNLGNICFSKNGSFFIFSNFRGLVEKFNFNRCTGHISNPITIFPEHYIDGVWALYTGCALSPNDKVLYIARDFISSYLYQYDLTAANIAATEDTIWTQDFPINAAGYMRLAPDNKIYLTCSYVPLNAPNYPYADSLYNMYNMNLSVVNAPDSLGAACNFQPYSFYLGGKRTYWGLPNNPDYDLPKLAGSMCDSLQFVGLTPQPHEGGENATLQTTYIQQWQKLFVNAQNLKGKNCVLKIFDVNGREVFSSNKKMQPPYYTQDVDFSSFASGMYLVNLQTEKESLSAKFVKE